MFRRSGFGFLLSLVFVLFSYTSAVADTPVFNSKDGKWYASINAGITILNDIGFSAAGGRGWTATGAGTLEFDASASFGGALGYVISDKIRTELELGYQQFDFDKVTGGGTLTNTSDGSTYVVAGEADIVGGITARNVLTNIILTPFGNKTLLGVSVTPMFGGGIGLVDWDSIISSVDTLTVVDAQESETDFLATAMVGLEYTNSQQVTWAIKYRHMWTDTGKDGLENAEADNIVANLKIAF
jgi:opacity protein-like surface antigen